MGRHTFSLFGLGRDGGDSAAEHAPTEESAATTKTPMARVATKAMSTAPHGMPTLSERTVDPRNNSVSGFITGAGGAFSKGQSVTTLAIVSGAPSANTVIHTKLGAR